MVLSLEGRAKGKVSSDSDIHENNASIEVNRSRYIKLRLNECMSMYI